MTPRQTPFHEVGMAAGAKMHEMFGYWLPWEYERGYIEEHIATRNRASICDLDYMAEFRVKGSSALQFVQMLLTEALHDADLAAASEKTNEGASGD